MKLLTPILLATVVSLNCEAQNATETKTGKTDSVSSAVTDSTPAKSTLTLGLVYCTNADYYGQAAAEKLPYLAAAATYRHTSGFYITGLAYRLLNDTAKRIASAENIAAGLEFKMGRNLSGDLSFSHTFYPALSPFLQAANANNASLTFAYDGWVKPSIGVDYAFGKTSDVFATGGLSKAVTLGSLGKKDVLIVTPAFSVVGGTQRFYQTYITQRKIADSVLGILFQPITGQQQTQNISTTKTVTAFNLLSYNLKIPLDYNRANYVLEASCQFSMLSNHVESNPGKINSFLSFSFFYQF